MNEEQERHPTLEEVAQRLRDLGLISKEADNVRKDNETGAN